MGVQPSRSHRSSLATNVLLCRPDSSHFSTSLDNAFCLRGRTTQMKAAPTGLPYFHTLYIHPPPLKFNIPASSEMKDDGNQSHDLIHQAHDQMWEVSFFS